MWESSLPEQPMETHPVALCNCEGVCHIGRSGTATISGNQRAPDHDSKTGSYDAQEFQTQSANNYPGGLTQGELTIRPKARCILASI